MILTRTYSISNASIALLILGWASLVAFTFQRPGGPTISAFESSADMLTFCGIVGNLDRYSTYCESNRRTTVTLRVTATDPVDRQLTYTYATTGGEILGKGARVTWRLSGASFGQHTATVTVSNSKGKQVTAKVTVLVAGCGTCAIPDPPCPTVAINSRDKVTHRGEKTHFEVSTQAIYFIDRPDYVWTVDGGRILSGQHTPYIEVEATSDIGETVTAKVTVLGFDVSCTGTSASYELPIKP